MLKNKIKFIMILLVVAAILSGCSLFSIKKIKPTPPAPTPPANNSQSNKTIKEQLAKQTKIKKFESAEELKNFMEENAVSRAYGYGMAPGGLRVRNLALG